MINSYVALDIETTGISVSDDRIIEIGMLKVIEGEVVDEYKTYIDPLCHISQRITELTGITDDDVKGAPCIKDVIEDIVSFIGELPMLGHNVVFDYSFIKKAAMNHNIDMVNSAGIDTLKMARRILPQLESKTLSYLCGQLQIDTGNSHRAFDDARSAMRLFNKMYELAPEDDGFVQTVQLVCKVKKDSPITDAQKNYLRALLSKNNITPDYDIDGLTKSKASRLIDSLISTYGKMTRI